MGPVVFALEPSQQLRALVQAIVTCMPMPDLEIICVDCGEKCYPLGWQPKDGEVEDGTVVPYRCSGCNDRWDVVIEDYEW